MKITVTAEMIERGVRCDSFRCPLTLAFNAAGFDVMVAGKTVDFYDAEAIICATFQLPPSAQRFQKRFDDSPDDPAARSRNFSEFSFEMPGLEPGVAPFTHFRSVAVAHALFGVDLPLTPLTGLMINHCDSSFVDRRFAGGRLPLSRQLPARACGFVKSPETRDYISLRDQRWSELKAIPVPSSLAVGLLRTVNGAVVKMLATAPPPFPPKLLHVEALLCQLCEIFLARCELELFAQRHPGSVNLDPEFVRRSFELAAADEELPAAPEPGEGGPPPEL